MCAVSKAASYGNRRGTHTAKLNRIIEKSHTFDSNFYMSSMKKTFLSLILTLAALVANAQDSQTGYNFLRLPVSAHAAALGGENITIIEDDASLTFHNPALLSSVSDKTLGLSFMTYMEGAVTAGASFSRLAGDRASWGVAAQYMDYGSMIETDENNVQTGEFSAKDIAVQGTFSYELTQRIVGGITARMITSYIGDYSSFAMGVDIGLNYYDPDHEWSVSAVAKNLGGELKSFDDEYNKMPFNLQLGVTKRIMNGPLRLSVTATDLTHWDYDNLNHLVCGLDIILSEQIYLAAGYNFRRADEMKIQSSDDDDESSSWAGISLGAGLQLERFKLQLAYAKYHVSSTSLTVNVAYCF